MQTKRMPNDSGNFSPAIRRARIQELTIYEISEDELKMLESGSPVSLYLNFSIFLLSVAISFAVTLATVHFPSDRAYMVFVTILIVSLLIGSFLIMLWLKQHRAGSNIAESVRNRLDSEGELMPLSSHSQPLDSKD